MSWTTTFDSVTGKYGKKWADDDPIIEIPSETTPTLEDQSMVFLRSIIASAAAISDDVAMQIPDLTAPWVVGEAVVEGNIRRYSEKTYRCRQDHTTQAEYTPDITPALWTVIELAATGTKDDPITASRGMEYVYGKYYKDPEDGKLYLCTRDSAPEGGTIILNYLPHELVSHYFIEVQNE